MTFILELVTHAEWESFSNLPDWLTIINIHVP